MKAGEKVAILEQAMEIANGVSHSTTKQYLDQTIRAVKQQASRKVPKVVLVPMVGGANGTEYKVENKVLYRRYRYDGSAWTTTGWTKEKLAEVYSLFSMPVTDEFDPDVELP